MSMSVADEVTVEPDNLPALPEPHGVDVTQPLGMPSPAEWNALQQMAQVLSQSGLVPSALRRKPDDIILILLTGRDLRLQPTVALQKIHVIEGKATASAELMTALVNRQPGMRVWPDPANDHRKATAHGVRDGQEVTFTFTIDDAARAGLAGKGNWAKWPQFMLWARAASGLCRMAFADVLAGVTYTPEEMGAEVDPETGEVAVSVPRSAPVADESPFLSEANVARITEKAESHGLDREGIRAMVMLATGQRTMKVEEVRKNEVKALREAMQVIVDRKAQFDAATDDTPAKPFYADDGLPAYPEFDVDGDGQGDSMPSLELFSQLAPRVAGRVVHYADDKKATGAQVKALVLALKRVCGVEEDEDQRAVLGAMLGAPVMSRALLTAGQVKAVLAVLDEEAAG